MSDDKSPHARQYGEPPALDFTVNQNFTAKRRSKRPPKEVETMEYLSAARRFIRAAGRRAGEGDEYELAELAALRAALDDAISQAVETQRTYGKSWAKIGGALGVSREAAWQRWSKK